MVIGAWRRRAMRAGRGIAMNLFCFGLGYCAQDFIARHGNAFETIAGTTRSYYAAECLGDARIKTHIFDSERAAPGIVDTLATSDVILVSIPPDTSTDPVLAKFGRVIATPSQPLKIIYLSTIGVYGDRGGEWIDEERIATPKSERSKARLRAEKAWHALAKDPRKVIQILRLSGIYGPGRNALVSLHEGTA